MSKWRQCATSFEVYVTTPRQTVSAKVLHGYVQPGFSLSAPGDGQLYLRGTAPLSARPRRHFWHGNMKRWGLSQSRGFRGGPACCLGVQLLRDGKNHAEPCDHIVSILEGDAALFRGLGQEDAMTLNAGMHLLRVAAGPAGIGAGAANGASFRGEGIDLLPLCPDQGLHLAGDEFRALPGWPECRRCRRCRLLQ